MKSHPSDVVVVLLAAGRSTRFGTGNKLLAPVGDRPLGLHVAAMLSGRRWRALIAVVNSEGAPLADAYRALGFRIIVNRSPEAGMGSSLALGASAAMASHPQAILVCLADMPMVPTVLIDLLLAEGANAVSQCGSVRTPPALLHSSLLPKLAALEGDEGAKRFLGNAKPVTAMAEWLADVDTEIELAALARIPPRPGDI